MYRKLLISAGGGIISSDQQAEQDNCATIAIGLGGTGISCLRTLKKEIFTRVKPDNVGGPIAQYKHIKYLAVDTDRSSLGDSGSIDTLDSTGPEFFDISCPDINGLLTQAHILAQDSSLNWLKTKGTQDNGAGISILSAQAGAGGVRQIGRLLLLQKAKEFVARLTHIITEARKDLGGSPSLNIHIFTGLGGGTGAGTFLDVCYLVQHALKQLGLAGQAYTCGYFFLPDINMANHPTEYVPINGFASMKELDYCMNFDNNGGEWNQQYDGFSIRTSEPPVKLAHLVTATDSDGNIVTNAYNYSMHTVVDYVLEYIIKPFVSEEEATAAEGVFTIKSHIANVNMHTELVDKKHGASYNYCVLGAANAYLPYKEILTYLTSKIFEGFANLPKQLPFDADVDMFVKGNGLEYNDIHRELCSGVPPVPNIPVDHKMLYEQVEGITTEVIPALLVPMRDVGTKIAGQLQKNKAALLNSDVTMAEVGTDNKLSLIVRIRQALMDIAQQADKGPYYASGMLHSLQARDLQKIVVGYKEQNALAIRNALGDLSLREKAWENTLNALQNSNALNRKKRAEEYANAVHAYFIQRYKIDTLQKMGELLTEFEKQLIDLNNGYFAIFASVMRELQETFAANLVTLSDPVTEDAGYAIKLMTIQDLQDALDESVRQMQIPGMIHNFVKDMLDHPDSWMAQDENKIAAQVTAHFLLQLDEYAHRTMEYYLKTKFETNDPALLQRKVYEEIIMPLSSKAAPRFWTEGGGIYSLADSASMGYLSIPNISDFIQAAAEQYQVGNGDIAIRTAWETDRITIFRFVCGVPMFGYKGVTTYKGTYRQKPIVGSHLYEGSAKDPRDSRELIDISPISCVAMYTPAEEKAIALYEFALANDIITKVPVGGGFEYHLNSFNSAEITACIETMQKILDAKDVQKAKLFIDSRKEAKFAVESHRVLPIAQNNDHAEYVIKDHVLGSALYVEMMATQAAALKQYEELLQELEKLANKSDEFTTNIQAFAMAVMTGVVKKVNDYEFAYCYEEYGIEESAELTTVDSEPYGMTLPLYSAFLGFCALESDIRQQIDVSVKEALKTKSEQVTAALGEVKTWIASEKVNGMMGIAKQNYFEHMAEIAEFLKRFTVAVTNFAATR
ncbi:MAG: hypothetical protein IJU16_08345 [Clostridia bacterium]|nr:hypothetical protein [Clostridia bacterium]